MRRLGVAAAVVDGALVPGDVGVRDGIVEAVALPPGASGLAVPGFVDLQVNGYAGVDLLSAPAEAWTDAARALARDGVAAYVANLITAPRAVTTAALRVASDVVGSAPRGAARLLGMHLEGPYLAPTRAGTHPAAHLRDPSDSEVDEWLAAGPVLGVTVAPELPGAIELVRRLAARGVLVSLGHSDATAEQAVAAFDAGARTVTHVFNAMSVPTARAPGLAGVALVRPDVAVQMVCDGVHLAPATAALVVAAARSRFVLVTDALAATGAGDGKHRLGDVEVVVVGAEARRRDDGTLAGSVLPMAGAVRHAVAAGASVEQAVAAATTRPADLLGRPDIGRLRPGDRADVAVLDDAFEVTAALSAGELVG